MILLYYLIAVSVISVIITVYDKLAAKAGLFRIPEATLLFFAAIGGAAAMYIPAVFLRRTFRFDVFLLKAVKIRREFSNKPISYTVDKRIIKCRTSCSLFMRQAPASYAPQPIPKNIRYHIFVKNH